MSTPTDEPVHTVTYFELAPQATAASVQFLRQWAQSTRKAEGAARFEVLQRTQPNNHIAFVAAWTARKHYDAAREGQPGTALRAGITTHLICGIDTRIHNNLIGGADAGRGSGTVMVVTHVDVPPPNKDACIALLETQVKASRAEAGCARLEVFQQADRPNHFSMVESWASQAAYDAHIIAGHTRQFRLALTPLSGALYDERIYSSLG